MANLRTAPLLHNLTTQPVGQAYTTPAQRIIEQLTKDLLDAQHFISKLQQVSAVFRVWGVLAANICTDGRMRGSRLPALG